MVSRKDHKDNKTGLKSRNQIGGGGVFFLSNHPADFRQVPNITDKFMGGGRNGNMGI